MPILESAQAEYERKGKANAAPSVHARTIHRHDAAGAGNASYTSGLQAKSKRRESFGGSRPADPFDPAESLPGKARQRLREECSMDRVGFLQAN